MPYPLKRIYKNYYNKINKIFIEERWYWTTVQRRFSKYLRKKTYSKCLVKFSSLCSTYLFARKVEGEINRPSFWNLLDFSTSVARTCYNLWDVFIHFYDCWRQLQGWRGPGHRMTMSMYWLRFCNYEDDDGDEDEDASHDDIDKVKWQRYFQA